MPLLKLGELALAMATVGILVVYHLLLYRRVLKAPLTTAIGITNHARRVWVKSVMDSGRDILAVQTLRNWVMAANFLASTAIIISLGLVAAAFRFEITNKAALALNLFGHPSEALWMFKLLASAGLFFSSFFNFTLAIRYYNHAGLLINVPPDLEPSATVDTVTAILNHGALHYTFGMRGFYLAIPLGLWLVGPLWMLVGALGMVFTLNRLDREA